MVSIGEEMILYAVATDKDESFEEGKVQESRLQHLIPQVTRVLEK